MVLDLYQTTPKYVIHDFASARDKDMLVATILSPKDPPIPKTNWNNNVPQARPHSLLCCDIHIRIRTTYINAGFFLCVFEKLKGQNSRPFSKLKAQNSMSFLKTQCTGGFSMIFFLPYNDWKTSGTLSFRERPWVLKKGLSFAHWVFRKRTKKALPSHRHISFFYYDATSVAWFVANIVNWFNQIKWLLGQINHNQFNWTFSFGGGAHLLSL